MHETILKFGYPDNTLYETDHWIVLLRPKQITLASLVLACKEKAPSIPSVSAAAFGEFPKVAKILEGALGRFEPFDKINYLLLMMKDKEVHFHVIPRYAKKITFQGLDLSDHDWPNPPNLASAIEMSEVAFNEIRRVLSAKFQEVSGQ